MSNKFIDNGDIVRGVVEVTVETIKRAGAGVLHLATQQFQNPTPSEHFVHPTEPPITDRPATYTWPHGSDGEYYGEVPDIQGRDLLPPEEAA